MEEQLVEFLMRSFPDAHEIVVEELAPIPGGYSRETYRFDARVRWHDREERLPLILRKDPPKAVQILETSRAIEHELIEALRRHTKIPVSRSFGHEMDDSKFGEPAMILTRMHGSSATSDLFNGGPDEHQVDDVIRHLCEVLVELHMTDISKLDPNDDLGDPRHVGIDTSTWDRYMDSTFEYYIDSFPSLAFDPSLFMLLDLFLTLRRTKPRPLPLSLVHGDFNPANFLYENGKATALIDWENSHIGDPREDLGWMTTMDILSNTNVMAHPRDEGGFLSYYNKLTGYNVTPEEIDYFTLFGSANIAVPINAAISRRLANEHQLLLHLYLLQPSTASIPNMLRLMHYPGVPS
jgi:aminoglycoside phosphotransferase (APT) family kinase protein